MEFAEYRERHGAIRGMIDDGLLDAAGDLVESLWEDLGASGGMLRGGRAALLAGLLARLMRESDAMRRRVARWRDSAGGAEGPPPGDLDLVRDWAGLNIVLGDSGRTIEWLLRMESDPRSLAVMFPLRGLFTQILREAGRWADLAKWFPDPVMAVRGLHANVQGFLRQAESPALGWSPQRAAEVAAAYFRDRCATVYAALLAGGRDAEAAQVADFASSLDAQPTAMRMALLAMAVSDAGQARQEHLRWLDESGDRGEMALELREKVERGLRP